MTGQTKYDWDRDIAPYLHTIQAVDGGYTSVVRGVVTINGGKKVFVKTAGAEITKKWLSKEIKVYQKLNELGYPFIPKLLSVDKNQDAMAIEYLEGASFENSWDKDKLAAITKAQDELTKYKSYFVDDPDFTLESVVGLDSKWPSILANGAIETINEKFVKLGIELSLTKDMVIKFEQMNENWKIADDTLVHQDIRADNFGYDPSTGEGKLIDWNWLCVGDQSLDRTPLFVNMYLSGFDPYVLNPEFFDARVLAYLVSFWLERVLKGNEDVSLIEFKRRTAQAESVKASIELIERGPTR